MIPISTYFESLVLWPCTTAQGLVDLSHNLHGAFYSEYLRGRGLKAHDVYFPIWMFESAPLVF